MNCCGGKASEGDEEARKESKVIDKTIKQEKKEADKKVKLLLLGTGDSGKSTFLKQMKVIHSNGFTKSEIEQFREVLRDNVMTVIAALINGCQNLNIQIPDKYEDDIKALTSNTPLTSQLAQRIAKLWKSKPIQGAWKRKNEINVYPWADYYLEHCERIAEDNYTPTNVDILRAKLRTTGINETKFQLGDIEFTIVDVGGQRNERRKWLHCFEGISSVIYLAALDEYDLKLEEDLQTNRLDESLKLFNEITGSQWLKDRSFILFLNKSDLFKEKLKVSPLSDKFKDYTGGDDSDAGIKYIESLYKKRFAGSMLYIYYTCAIDTNNVTRVFNAVKDTIIVRGLQSAGFGE
jgi:guanine nucleotide-binding protein G(i) subunit alpha